MYLHISVRSTGRESTKLQQSNEHSIQGPRRETTLTPKPCATESRGLIDISSRIVHSAANWPKHMILCCIHQNKYPVPDDENYCYGKSLQHIS